MNKPIIFFIMLILIGLGQIRFWDDYVFRGGEFEAHINVVNDNSYDITDVSVKVELLGEVLRSRSFDVDDYDSQGLWFHYRVPKYIPKGEHLVKITASNDDFKDVEYRYITVV